jgi:integrase
VLEQLFFPRKVGRIRRCWLAAGIEWYLAWLRQRGFSEHVIRDRAAHLLRVRGQPRAGDVRDMPADRRDPDETDASAAYAVPGARRDCRAVRAVAVGRSAHPLRPRVASFLYNTGTRVQEAADLRVEHIDLERGPRARLHCKGGKWRTCPLWDETARLLRQLVGDSPAAQAPAFCSAADRPLTRSASTSLSGGIPHVFRTRAPPPAGSGPTSFGTRPPCTCWKLASRST